MWPVLQTGHDENLSKFLQPSEMPPPPSFWLEEI
jgi:hypothetical protein